MKKIILSVSICLMCTPAFSQWTSNGNIISTTQNVGIGTTAPTEKLDVNGNIKTNGTVFADKLNVSGNTVFKNFILSENSCITRNLSDSFIYQSKDLRYNSFGWYVDSWDTGSASLWQSGAGGMKFFTGGQFRLAIHRLGNIGIGTENPTQKLEVSGNTKTSNLLLPSEGQITVQLSDVFVYEGRSMGHYALGWMADPWNSGGNTLWQAGYGGIKFFTAGQYRMGINSAGNVGVGTATPTQKLDVNGNIKGTNFYANGTVFANEVKVEATKWSDFVFDKEYKLLPLEDVKAHIEEHKHLPDVPSEKQVLEEGINVAEMQAKLLQKIEELTLYVIQQDAKNKALEQEMKELKASLSKE